MPTLDMTDVIVDSIEFVDIFTVKRRTQSIGTNGLVVDSIITYPNIHGCVLQNDNIRLNIDQDSQHLTGSITIYSTFVLTDGNLPNIDADLVIWNGRTYQVIQEGDYTQWGLGFRKAVCSLQMVSP